MRDGIRDTRLEKQILILKIRDQRARRRVLVDQQGRTLLASARLLVRQKLRDGSLPREGGPVFVGGPGKGGHCSACGGTLRIKQLVMEIAASDPGSIFSLHADCFVLWDSERRKL